MKTALLVLMPFLFLTSASPAATQLERDAERAIRQFQEKDPHLKKFFNEAAGYAVFPNVGKGGFIIGAAHGNGVVYKSGSIIGSAELAQGSIGLQIGGQEFSEVIFFKTPEALADFKLSQLVVSAETSAVVAAEGAGLKAKYNHDVAVFLLPKSGAMLEASVGGQKFQFKAKK